MKKIVIMLAMTLAMMTAAASNTLYFTYNQALRSVSFLNNQNELMIYCGYEDELPTYVIVNEVWAEQISSSYYEIWLYGYDAYTGEEIYMPIDMEYIWLVRNKTMYSAAQYLRFRNTHPRPVFTWAMPRYNPFVRAPRPVTYYYTYHYDIHRPGWHFHHHPDMHYHPYYCRKPHTPAPMPPAPFTPGKDRPGFHQTGTNAHGEIGYEYIPTNTTGSITANRSKVIVQNDPTSRSGNRITSNRSDNTVTTTDRLTGSRSTSQAPNVTQQSRGNNSSSRSTATSRSDNSRGNSTATSTGSRGSSNATSRSDNSRSTTTGTSRSGNTNSGTSSSRSNASSSSRSGNTSSGSTSRSTSTSTSRSSNTSTGTTSRGSSTSTSRSSNTSTGTTTTGRGTSTSTSRSSNTDNTSTSSRGTSTSTTRSSNTTSRQGR